ncbi:Chromatid cohesion factor MAU2 [Trinorchestia longiramus]|nr:Chromatid cohesion factor MAU2 [Trinorchestia longiramus]
MSRFSYLICILPGIGSPQDKHMPEVPMTCCQSGCPNCVWLDYVEKLTLYYQDGGMEAVKAINRDIQDPNLQDNITSTSAVSTAILPTSKKSSEKNVSLLRLTGSINLSKEKNQQCEVITDFINIGHPSNFSRFDDLLLQRWREASAAGALNYHVHEVLTKILPGKYGIVAQLNPARAMKRRKPLPFTKVDEPFDAKGFNFTKIKSNELLFNIHLSLSSGEKVEGSLIVNAAPICPSHSLLLPSVVSCQPQVIDRQGFLLAVSTVLLSNLRSFRVGFNSLCAYASVNHHHYHCYYLPQQLYVEAAACHHIHGRCYAFTDHYAPGFVFQADPECIMDCVCVVMKLLSWLVSAEVPHNIFITRGLPLTDASSASCETQLMSSSTRNKGTAEERDVHGHDQATSATTSTADGAGANLCIQYSAVRVCVWVRQPATGAKAVSVFAPALCELAGHVPIYDPGQWDQLNEKDITDEIHSICKDSFTPRTSLILYLYPLLRSLVRPLYSMASSQDSYYLSLLALAESFRTEHPPKIRHSLHCLKAVFLCDPPPKVAARTHLQIAILLSRHAHNPELTKNHLQQAWNLSQNIAGFDDVRFASAHQLSICLLEESITNAPAATVGSGAAASIPSSPSIDAAKSLLMRAVEMSSQNAHWHCRLLLHAARACLLLKEYSSAASLLQRGFDYTNMHDLGYLRLVFQLSKIMVVMAEGNGSVSLNDIQQMLSQALSSISAVNATSAQKEHLKVFALVLLTTNQLNLGQVKSAKPVLKQLQQSIQTVSQGPLLEKENSGSCVEVQWLSRSELGVLVYLVSVRHSMHAGYMDKAHKYTEKALSQISKIRESSNASHWLEVLLVEHTALCHLVMGSKMSSLSSITRLSQLLRAYPNLAQSHVAQVHTLLAVYAMSMKNLEAAEQQFNAALRTSQNRELWTFANLNLGVVYLRSGREQDFIALQERIHPDAVRASSHGIRAAAYYVQGMHAFFSGGHDDAKRHLREALKMANAEDLNRLTSCALVLLGHLFFCAGSPREAANMASPAMQLASKIPDLHLQLWASSLLKDIHNHFKEASLAAVQECNHRQYGEQLANDQRWATEQPQHLALLSWTTGPLPHLEPMPS